MGEDLKVISRAISVEVRWCDDAAILSRMHFRW